MVSEYAKADGMLRVVASDQSTTHGTITLVDLPPPIMVGLTRHQWIEVDSSESDWMVVVNVVVVVFIVGLVVVEGVGIGRHPQNIKGRGVGWSDTDGTITVVDTPPPIMVGLTRYQWIKCIQ
jgi:hypothetical protein